MVKFILFQSFKLSCYPLSIILNLTLLYLLLLDLDKEIKNFHLSNSTESPINQISRRQSLQRLSNPGISSLSLDDSSEASNLTDDSTSELSYQHEDTTLTCITEDSTVTFSTLPSSLSEPVSLKQLQYLNCSRNELVHNYLPKNTQVTTESARFIFTNF